MLDQRRVASRGPGPNPQQMRFPQYEDVQPMQPPPPVRPMSPIQQQPMQQQQQQQMQQQPLQQQPTTQQPVQTMAEGIDSFKDGVSSNLKAMTDLLKDMKESQGLQSEDVKL